MPVKKTIKRVSTSREPMIEISTVAQTERDFKDAVLMVSIFANLFILCIWVALQTTSIYDEQLANFFINR